MLVVRAGPAQTGQRQMDPWQIGFLRQSPVQHGLGPVMLANAHQEPKAHQGVAFKGVHRHTPTCAALSSASRRVWPNRSTS